MAMVGVLAFWPLIAPPVWNAAEGRSSMRGCKRGYVLMWINIVCFSPLDLFFFFFSPCQPRIANEKSYWHLGLANPERGSVNDIG